MIYVDKAFEVLSVPRKWEGGGHMMGTDLEELHTFAKSIGLRRAWFQEKSFAHYDLTASKQRQAIAKGATVIDPFELPDDLLQLDEDTGEYIQRSELLKKRGWAE